MSESGNEYPTDVEFPALVRRCADVAAKLGFRNSCNPVYGRLLHVLAASCRGAIGEMGTGCGVGTAWMASSASPETRIVTIELNEDQASAAREALSDVMNVTVLQGDAFELASHGPFDLLFCDSVGKRDRQKETVAMMKPGGIVVLDDLTTGRTGPDDVRDWWLVADEVLAVEVALSHEHAAILAVRR
jgi:predicted O-methyltransferase YrrM